MNKDVFLAILSVDSYGRGYNQGVKGLSDTGGIGNSGDTIPIPFTQARVNSLLSARVNFLAASAKSRIR